MNAIPLKSLLTGAMAIGSSPREAPLPRMDSFPEVVAAAQVYAEAKAQRRDADRELSEARSQLNAAHSMDDDALDAAANAQLSGKAVEVHALRASLEMLTRKAAVASRAEGLARQRLDAAKAPRVRELVARLSPRYRQAVRRIAEQIAALHQANLDCEEVRKELERAGVSPMEATLMPMTFYPALIGGMGGSPAETWIATARHNGFLGSDDLNEILAGAR